MPKDISSSSEAESENPPVESQPKQIRTGSHEALVGKTTRYQCPVDFVSASYKPCKSILRKKLKKSTSELWLIKAPASFDPECFQGVQVPLSGLQTLKVHATKGGVNSEREQQIYTVRASAHGTSELYLLTSDKNSSESVVGPTFSGLLTVCESYEDKSANQPLQVIPAPPAPSIPPSLAHRFHLLSKATSTQTGVTKTETDGLSKRHIEETEEEDEGRKKKKKRKKEKKIKLEQEEETDVLKANENVAEVQDQVKTEPPFQECSVSEERKKRKKKKKDNGQEEVEQVVEDLMVKCEPVDSWNNDVVEGPVKKKKNKKKSKTEGD